VVTTVSTSLSGELPHDFLHVHTAEEFDSFAHQLQQYCFALWTDSRQASQIDNQFAVLKICSRSLVGTPEFSGPRIDELALNDYSALALVFDNCDFQHAALVLGRESATQPPKSCRSNYLVSNARNCTSPWKVGMSKRV
jgi:hypothetical protein